MKSCKLTFTFDKLMGNEVLTEACRIRLLEQQRASMAEQLKCPVDSCYTTAELFRDMVAEGLICKI
jgi:hypothetical protein